MKSVAVLLLLAASHSLAGSYSSVAEFCKLESINKESKDKTPTTNHASVIEQMGKILSGEKDCAFIKDNYNKDGWALIDARDPETRKSTGTFEAALKIVSDHKDMAQHQFTKDALFPRLAKRFSGGRAPASAGDMQEKKLIVFCNGLKCYRTPWAACSLNKMGFKKENIYLVLDGHDALKGCIK